MATIKAKPKVMVAIISQKTEADLSISPTPFSMWFPSENRCHCFTQSDLMVKGFIKRGVVSKNGVGGFRGKLRKTREWGQHDSLMFTKEETSAKTKLRTYDQNQYQSSKNAMTLLPNDETLASQKNNDLIQPVSGLIVPNSEYFTTSDEAVSADSGGPFAWYSGGHNYPTENKYTREGRSFANIPIPPSSIYELNTQRTGPGRRRRYLGTTTEKINYDPIFYMIEDYDSVKEGTGDIKFSNKGHSDIYSCTEECRISKNCCRVLFSPGSHKRCIHYSSNTHKQYPKDTSGCNIKDATNWYIETTEVVLINTKSQEGLEECTKTCRMIPACKSIDYIQNETSPGKKCNLRYITKQDAKAQGLWKQKTGVLTALHLRKKLTQNL